MSHVESYQRGLTNRRTTNQHLVYRITQDRRIRSQVRAYGDSPDCDLVPRQEITGEAQEQSNKEKSNANHPVEFSGGLVRTMIKDANHVQGHGFVFLVRRPP